MAIIQSSAGLGNRSFPNPIAAGNTLVLAISKRSGNVGPLTGYTLSPLGVSASSGSVQIYTKVAGASEPQITNGIGAFDGNFVLGWYELTAGSVPVRWVSNVVAVGDVTNDVATLPSLRVGSGGVAIVIFGNRGAGVLDAGILGGSAWHWAGTSPLVEDVSTHSSSGWPGTLIAHAPAGTFTPQATWMGVTTADSYHWFAQAIAFSGDPAPPGIELGVYDPADVFLSDLTDAFEIEIRREHNGVGTGSFSINRSSAEATEAILTPGNYVRVTVPQIDPDPILGFFLEAGNFDLISSDEKGGEKLSFMGRGGLSYWDRAIWLAESFFTPWWPTYLTVPPATPPSTAIGALAFPKGWYYHYTVSGSTTTARTKFYTNGFTAYYDTRKRYTRSGLPTLTLVHLSTGVYSGYYVNPFTPTVRDYRKKNPYTLGPSVLMSSISAAKRPGEILYAMYQESQSAARPDAPLPGMTIDFSDTLDSAGNAWTVTDALNGVSAELGDDYLSTVGKLVNTGSVDVVMGPDLDMHAYNAYGRDLHSATFASGKVRFAKAVNIADALTREYTDQPVGTFAEVIGNQEGAIARVFLPSAGSRPAREISVRGDTADTDALTALGLSELAARLLHSDAIGFAVATPTVGAEDELSGLYLPGPPGSDSGNYWVGDLVTLHTGSGEHDFNEATVRIAAITLSFSDADDLRVVVEVGSGFGGMPQISASSSSSTAPSSGTPVSSLSDLYQLISERDQRGGYPSLDDDGHVDPSLLAVQWKQSVRVATTGAGTLASSFEAGDTVDGITLVEGDDILIKDQASALANGIYSVEASGAPTRRTDMDADVEVVGAVVLVREGTANGGTVWRATNLTDPSVGTDAITFAAFAPPVVKAGGPWSIPYTFSTTTTDADPGSGFLRLSNATQYLSITIRADLADTAGADVTALLDAIDTASGPATVKGFVRLQKVDDPTKWLVATVSAVASPTGYRNITIANIAKSANSPFANGDVVVFSFVPSQANPATTSQDLLVAGAGGILGRLAKGSDGQVLTVDPATHLLAWATPSGGSSTLTVEEVDASPTDAAITKIVFPNGTLAIAAHVATYTPAATGGGGGPGDKVYAYQSWR